MSAVSFKKFGSGQKTLVLFPGWIHPIEKEPVFLELLSQRYSVVAVYLPGYGETPHQSSFTRFSELVPDIHQFLSSYEPDDVVLVGFSMGCRLIAELDKQQPSQFKKIFVGYPPDSIQTPLWSKLLIQNRLVIDVLRTNAFFMNFAVTKALKTLTNDPKVVFTSPYVSLLGAFDSLVGTLMSQAEILKYENSALFIYGEHDTFYIHEPGKEPKHLHLIKGAGHNCVRNWEAEIIEAMETFIK